MKVNYLFAGALLASLAAGPLAATVSCPPSSPWPPTSGPVVKTVPWVVPQAPACLIVPHDVLSGSSTYLKATTDTTPAQYYWDYGDGSPAMAWTTVSDKYNIGATHTYTGSPNTSFTATVYVKDSGGHVNSAKYYVTIRASSLAVQVNIAIDQALWRLHRELTGRSGSGATGIGYWNSGNNASSGYYGNYAANTTAFLVNGHQPDGDPANPNPYAETVTRGINGTLMGLASTSIPSSVTNKRGTFNPDGNGNGLGIYVPQNDMYQDGMIMDMIAATGQPGLIAQVGGSGIVGQTFKTILQDLMDYTTYCQSDSYNNYSGGWRYSCRSGDSDGSVCQWHAIGMIAATDPKAGFKLAYPAPITAPWSAGTTFNAGDVVSVGATYYQSLAGSNIGHAPATSPTWWAIWPPVWNVATIYPAGAVVSYGGGYYQSIGAGNAGHQPDVSTAFWSFYDFGTPPYQSPVILANKDWLTYVGADGHGFGYTDPGYYPWGAWAVTPSGMVQMVMDSMTAGPPGAPGMWDHTEDWIRANFSGPLGYYYGLFSFTKSMLLYPGGKKAMLCARDGFPSNNPTNCIDWYAAETSLGAPINGVARTLVNSQASDGYWWCHEQDSRQCYFETAWATIMLNQTVFQSGLPVAVIDASPTTIINGATVNFTGKNSFHQDATKQIIKWEWDFSGTGSGPFSTSGVNQLTWPPSGPGIPISTTSTTFPYNFPVRLRVTDNSTPTPLTAISTMNVVITNPPFNPTANAGGPYSICPQTAYLPFYFNGSGSKAAPGHLAGTTNPDNSLTYWEWDLLGNGTYVRSGASLPQPRVDDYYATHDQLGNACSGATCLLGSGSTILAGLRVTDNSAVSFGAPANLQGTATAQVVLRSAADLLCSKCVSTGQAIPHGAVTGKAAYISLVWLETGADHYNIYRGTADGGPYTKIGTVVNTLVGTGKSLGYSDTSTLTAGVTYYYRIAPATVADVETCQSNQANANATIPKVR